MSSIGRAFVTGATGRIGSHLVDVLLEGGVSIRALCLPGDFRSNRLRGAGVEVVEGSLADVPTLTEAVADVDGVFHLGAALTNRGASRSEIFHSIARGTFNLLEGIRRVQRKGVRLLSVSSSAVYYSAPGSPSPGVRWDETTRVAPSTLYGASKRAAELLVEASVSNGECSAVLVRPSNTADPEEILDPHSIFGRRWFTEGAIGWYESSPPDAVDRVSPDIYRQLKRHRDARLFYRRVDTGPAPTVQIANARSVAELLARSIDLAGDDPPHVMNVVADSIWPMDEFVHRIADFLDIPASSVVPVEDESADRPWLFGTSEQGRVADVFAGF